MYNILIDKTATLLRMKREEAGISVSSLAKQMGVTYSAVFNWENAKKIPSIPNLLYLSRLYNCRIEDLLLWEEYE